VQTDDDVPRKVRTMFTWASGNDSPPSEGGNSSPHPPVAERAVDDKGTFHFAVPRDGPRFAVSLLLLWTGREPPATPPALRLTLLTTQPEGVLKPTCSVDSSPLGHGRFRCTCRMEIAPPPVGDRPDDEFELLLDEPSGAVPPCRLLVRRTACTIDDSLLEECGRRTLHAQTRAALLWHGWNRYREVVALKAFTAGKGQSDVLVVQPGLRQPPLLPADSGAAGVLAEAWGSCLLVKTGPADKVRGEWQRFHTFLADRLHPFMTRSEAFLTAQPGGADLPPDGPVRATLISSFLGGNLIEVESLESVVRGPTGVNACLQVLERLFLVLGDWYATSRVETLDKWYALFSPVAGAPDFCNTVPGSDGGQPAWRLLGKYDFRDEKDRSAYAAGLTWDVDFVREEHLSRHLLGRPGQGDSGLLPRLMKLEARFSLVHGDLHPRNVLLGRDDVWLIDFGKTGVAPTLADFAALEVFLRLWGLDLGPGAGGLDVAAEELERLLLGAMAVGEAHAEEVRALAVPLGARPDNLVQVAACIAWIRRRVAAYSLGRPDRRDYLAVLYLTLLRTLRYARKDRDKAANYRLLMALFWLVEGVLSRMVGLEPIERQREPLRPEHLLEPRWLERPGAPARVAYFLEREDGRRALPTVAATRGVLQNQNHHLDVFDHTLLALANLEELLADPLDAFLEPSAYQERVRDSLRRQGFPVESFCPRCEDAGRVDAEAVRPHLDEIGRRLDTVLDQPSRLLLKWSILLHDVGKPATRGLSRKDRAHFLGHEVYGLDLLEEQLERLYPVKDDAARHDRLRGLIRRHHEHHKLFHYFLGTQGQELRRFPSLRAALQKGDSGEAGMKLLLNEHVGTVDFPLLILHGFADIAACCGAQADVALARVAEVDLVLLAVWVCRARLLRRREIPDEAKRRDAEEFAALRLPESCRRDFSSRFRRRYLRLAAGPALAATPCGPPDAAAVRRLAEEVVGELRGEGILAR
jgi:hypothetical protein